MGKAEEVLPAWYAEQQRKPEAAREKIDVICVDPPRKGCDEACLQTMLQVAPERIVYVSCDSATLARDLKYLLAGGQYSLTAVQPVDMFPQTVHIETVVLLSQQNPDDRIRVKVDLDELDETSAELLQANMNYEALLAQKNEFQNALEAMQDDLAVRLALAEEESKPNKQLPKYSNVDYANEQLREYYDQLQKLQDSVLTLQIENTLLRETIDEYTN